MRSKKCWNVAGCPGAYLAAQFLFYTNPLSFPLSFTTARFGLQQLKKKRVAASLKAAQRPFALVIGRLFKSTSTDAALVLANIVPLHLKVVEIVAKRLISWHAALLPPSSRRIAGDIPERILTPCKPVGISLRLHRERLLKSEIQYLWNQIWSTAANGAQTRLFFPSVEAAAILDSPLTPYFLHFHIVFS